VADAWGRLVRGRLTAGQRPAAPQSLPLRAGLAPAYFIAYHYDSLGAALTACRTQALILPRRKRRTPQAYDAARYAQCCPIERLFSQLK